MLVKINNDINYLNAPLGVLIHKKVWVHNHPLGGQILFWSDCANAQIDLSLNWSLSDARY